MSHICVYNICYICSLKRKYKRKFLLFEEIVWTLKGEISEVQFMYKTLYLGKLNLGKESIWKFLLQLGMENGKLLVVIKISQEGKVVAVMSTHVRISWKGPINYINETLLILNYYSIYQQQIIINIKCYNNRCHPMNHNLKKLPMGTHKDGYSWIFYWICFNYSFFRLW